MSSRSTVLNVCSQAEVLNFSGLLNKEMSGKLGLSLDFFVVYATAAILRSVLLHLARRSKRKSTHMCGCFVGVRGSEMGLYALW